MTKLSAAIFMPEEELQNAELLGRCLDHISAAGHHFDSIVSDWQQLLTMLREQTVQIVVYARPEHIDPHWLPRFELAGVEAPDLAESHPDAPARARRRERRPRIVQN